MHSKKFLHKVLPILIILFGVAGFFFLKSLKKEPPHFQPKLQGPLVEVISAKMVDHQVVIHASGVVRAKRCANIVSQVAGKVVWVSPKFVAGGVFSQGEIMFQIEKKDYEIALVQAKAKVLKAEEQLKIIRHKAKVAKDQWKRLHGDQPPPSPLVFYEPQLEAAQAALKAAKAAYQKAKLNLLRTTVRAPFDCVISEKYIDIGSYVSPGIRVARVVGTKKAEIICPVSLKDLSWIRFPANTKVKIDTGEHTYFYKGKALRVLPTVDRPGRMPQLIVEVDDPYQQNKYIAGRPNLSEGLFVELEIMGKVAKHVFVLPRRVLRRGNTVWIVDKNDQLQIIPVKIVYEEKDVVVVRGLRPGERIIVTDLEAVAPGLKVRVLKKGGQGERSHTLHG